ncbi:MAG: DUF5686 and carboxypeptidase regulatory-like domain-containing protein [Bacteroidales bacterium]|nr:DUF5686 and carboxypeptidase regulatory-like domain-containing protein [Bacteroidales bacterium]
MTRLYYFTLVFIVFIIKTQAQNVQGIVIDSKTKLPLPFVNIVYNEQGHGTTSNMDGEFDIKTNSDKLYLSYMGYYSDTVKITGKKLRIKLKPRTFKLKEAVVFSRENPANRIIRKVTENRDLNNPEQLESFSFKSYNKVFFTEQSPEETNQDTVIYEKLFSDSIHLFLIESLAERKYLKPNKYKEKVIATKISGIKDPIFSVIASQSQSFSFYNEFYTIAEKSYINPISKGSTKRYFFMIQDTLYSERGDSTFVISFQPKRGKHFLGLKGLLHINTNQYAIQSVVAEPAIRENFMHIKIKQQYDWIENKCWFPRELDTEIELINAAIRAKGKSYISDIKLNPDLNKNDFDDIEFEISDNAMNYTEDYWETKRTHELKEIERRSYHLIDSVCEEINITSIVTNLLKGGISTKYIDIPISRIIGWNYYEGYRFGVGGITNKNFSKIFSVGGYFAYGLKDKAWKYGGNITFNLHKKSESKLDLSYINDVKRTSEYEFLQKPAFLSNESYRDIFIKNMNKIEKYELAFSFNPVLYLKTKLFINQSHEKSTSNYFYSSNTTIPINNYTFNEIGLQLRYAYGEKYAKTSYGKMLYAQSNAPIIMFNLIKGVNWLNSKYEYLKCETKITKSFKTKQFGKTDLTLVAGITKGNVPLTKLYNGHGNPYFIESQNSFNTMSMGEFYSDRFLSVFIRHNFMSALYCNSFSAPRVSLVHNYQIGSFDKTKIQKHLTNEPIKTLEKGYFETGILINDIIKNNYFGLGFGTFYRYGSYQYSKISDNFMYKLTVVFSI